MRSVLPVALLMPLKVKLPATRRVVHAGHGDVQLGGRGVAGLIAMQRVGDIEGGALSVLHMLEVGVQR